MGEQEKRQNESGVSFGSYRLDVGNAQLRRGAQEVKLTGKAFAVLRYFVEHPGQLATKDDLFAAAWPETVVSEATLVSCIQELRQALRDDAKKPRYIETVHRRGYRFLPTVTTPPVPSAEFRAPSQAEGVSSQYSVDSRQEEENRQVKGEQIETERENSEQAEGLRL
jgi:DNA-binding winged helix-turn-helix (wHTH) protein